uniref:Glucosidase 2 subunit beta n=1 Tax=Noctiluca scintillans TaxID=2966 RepID=A0A7S0ZW21_NOCSC
MSPTVVNDDYCDCNDGSDEPGTGACGGQDATLFFCLNEGGSSERIYTSRVNDLVCDCCDGSDETTVRCPNTCAEEGAREREARRLRAEMLTEAINLRNQASQDGAASRVGWLAEIKQLESELPALQATHDAAQAAKMEAEEEKRKLDQAQKEEEEKTKAAEEAAKAAEEAGKAAEETGKAAEESAAPVETQEASEEALPGETESSKVSEYAQWMEGAEDSLSQKADSGAVKGDQDGKESKVSEYATWMEGAEDTLADEGHDGEDDVGEEGLDGLDGDEGEFELSSIASQAKSADAKEADPLDAIRETFKAAQTARNKNMEETRNIKKKVELIEGKEAYATLMDKTLERKIGEYTYKISFFNNAKQEYTALGNWEKWTGSDTALFDGGAQCWNGPKRSLEVTFECSIANEIIEVHEPSRCAYAASVGTPAACTDAELEGLLGPLPTKNPRFEL